MNVSLSNELPNELPNELAAAQAALQAASQVAVLTGAGVSAASGIPTFRGAQGLWRHYRPEDLATPQAYQRDPLLVWEWYAMRWDIVCRAQPNPAHYALAKLATAERSVTVVTQNVDGLHQRAGSQGVLELHGNLTHSRCEHCAGLDPLEVPLTSLPPHCSRCGERARPNVVWFGEMLPQATFDAALHAFAQAQVALIVGTSARVEPAASLGRLAAQQGAFVIEINPEPTPLTAVASVALQCDAVAGMLALCAEAS